MSKQAAIEQEPLTLEKDKSYPNPPVLNMKWANRNINVIEWANIQSARRVSDSSKASGIILYDVLVDIILCYIKLYGRESKH